MFVFRWGYARSKYRALLQFYTARRFTNQWVKIPFRVIKDTQNSIQKKHKHRVCVGVYWNGVGERVYELPW